ncbi:hypothetical protein [Pseudonocardia broussonetiae]|uniref:Uncharacterized protein n=1 Tax=Pseudonocardia broussonetiae TaxID=2736640 RepID=A0A6M6JST0_9PSEU|nr:hypothetical protein [Pseudonocardia broussonetiae]QJY51154.1 hypothetical protein HOP40_34805 [Pseudonocardia broussonetiae]
MPDDLRAAVEAVAVALDALRAAPGAVAVIGAVDQAAAAVAVLEPDLTGQVLQQLVLTIEHGHRVGLAHSPQLERAYRAAAVALQIDPRWV